jgi:hypothetical protein
MSKTWKWNGAIPSKLKEESRDGVVMVGVMKPTIFHLVDNPCNMTNPIKDTTRGNEGFNESLGNVIW